MGWLKCILIFVVSFLIYHIGFGCNVFPVDENNVLQAPAWYPILGILISFITTFALSSAKKSTSTPTFTKGLKNVHFAEGAEKESAQKLTDEAKRQTVEINNSSTVFDFIYSYQEFRNIVKKLIYLNEKKHIYMYPTPRSELEKAESNIGATINDFISRAIGRIWPTGTEWADEVDLLLDEIESDKHLSKLLTADNRARICQLRKRAEQERNLCSLDHDVYDHGLTPDPPLVDVEQIIFEENKWCKMQQGLSFAECELEMIDEMDGHTFERWCADLLKKIGFQNVEVTQGSGDQGVDILAVKDGIKYAIQCKCYSSDLGNKPVQEVNTGRAIYHCQIGAVMTNRRFTAGGKEAAEATGVLLWDRDWIYAKLESISTQEGVHL